MNSKFGADFPFFEKVHVNGAATHPIYLDLKKQSNKANITWNFSKFLVDKNMKVMAGSNAKDMKPLAFEPKIREMLGLKSLA